MTLQAIRERRTSGQIGADNPDSVTAGMNSNRLVSIGALRSARGSMGSGL
jgi:hypothetical protein